MVNEVVILGVVSSSDESSGRASSVVLTGLDPDQVRMGKSKSVRIEVVPTSGRPLQTGSLVFLRGALKTMTDVVDGVKVNRSFVWASTVLEMAPGPYKVSGSRAFLANGTGEVALFNYVRLIGLSLYSPRVKEVSESSILYYLMLATSFEEKIGGEWKKSTDYNRVIAWNMRWLPGVAPAESLVEVEGHLQMMVQPVSTEGSATFSKAEVIAHNIQVRTEWFEHAVARWRSSPSYNGSAV